MRKIYYFLVVLILFEAGTIKAQDTTFYYTLNDNKIDLIKNNDKYFVEFKTPVEIVSNDSITKLTDQRYIVSDTTVLNSYSPYELTLSYVTSDNQELYYPRGEILLKFKSSTSSSSIENLAVT